MIRCLNRRKEVDLPFRNQKIMLNYLILSCMDFQLKQATPTSSRRCSSTTPMLSIQSQKSTQSQVHAEDQAKLKSDAKMVLKVMPYSKSYITKVADLHYKHSRNKMIINHLCKTIKFLPIRNSYIKTNG